MRQKQLLELILEELKKIHYHSERVEAFTMLAHNIKEDGKTGAWIEDAPEDRQLEKVHKVISEIEERKVQKKKNKRFSNNAFKGEIRDFN